MPSSFVLLLSFLVSVCALPPPGPKQFKPRLSFRIGAYTPEPFHPPSEDKVSPHYLTLSRSPGSLSHQYLRSLQKGNQVNGNYGFTQAVSDDYSTSFIASIEFANEMFQVIIDTGSSDTWLAETGYQCVDATTQALRPESYCDFGTLYNVSSTFKQIPNENFNIEYGDGEFLTGIFGTEQVTIAGITVKNQQVALANYAGWYGDGIASGILGLAFPALTSAYAGNDPSHDSQATEIPYNPIFTNMYTEGNVAPMFSLAINRGNIPGLMAFGGLPPVTFFPFFASVPFQVLTIQDAATSVNGKPQYGFYAININAIVYPGSKHTTFSTGTWPSPLRKPANASHIQAIVDSGTILNYFPTAISSAINAQFGPSTECDPTQGVCFVDCDATVPKVGVTISGRTFYINPQDLILDVGIGDNTCITGIYDGGQGPYILGDVFLKNVLAVFDVGASQMRFAAREFY